MAAPATTPATKAIKRLLATSRTTPATIQSLMPPPAARQAPVLAEAAPSNSLCDSWVFSAHPAWPWRRCGELRT